MRWLQALSLVSIVATAALIGASAWRGAGTSLSALPAGTRPTWEPTQTPDNRPETAIAMMSTALTMLEPTPTKTKAPTEAPTPTLPPCEQVEVPEGDVTVCRQGTATPTPTPRPVRTAAPEMSMCGTPQSDGTLPELCLKTDAEAAHDAPTQTATASATASGADRWRWGE